jgi:hypothetical protein
LFNLFFIGAGMLVALTVLVALTMLVALTVLVMPLTTPTSDCSKTFQ